jgi:hypothetical protein
MYSTLLSLFRGGHMSVGKTPVQSNWDFWQMTNEEWNSLASELQNLLILVLYPNLHLIVPKFRQAKAGLTHRGFTQTTEVSPEASRV